VIAIHEADILRLSNNTWNMVPEVGVSCGQPQDFGDISNKVRRAGSVAIMISRSKVVIMPHAAISSSVRAQPRQRSSSSIAQMPVHGEAIAGGVGPFTTFAAA
jgi:hypothetical protein